MAAADRPTCLIAGGGPAGMALGLLLARATLILQAAQRLIHAKVIAGEHAPKFAERRG